MRLQSAGSYVDNNALNLNTEIMKYSVLILFILIGLKVQAQNCARSQTNLSAIGATVCSNDSLEMIEQLKTQGFRCDSMSENLVKRGVLCKGKLSTYSQPVRIYVSPNYQKNSPANINMHFHGHRLNGIDTFQTNSTDTSGHGDYGARLVESQSKELLVIPESLGNCATYDTELNDQQETQNFILALEKTTGLSNANYKLTSHSGGARILNKVLLNGALDGRVQSVGLFDSIYEDQAGVKKFLKASLTHKVVVNYLENGSTQKMTSYFISTTKDFQKQIELVPINKANAGHMNIINQGSFSRHLSN